MSSRKKGSKHSSSSSKRKSASKHLSSSHNHSSSSHSPRSRGKGSSRRSKTPEPPSDVVVETGIETAPDDWISTLFRDESSNVRGAAKAYCLPALYHYKGHHAKSSAYYDEWKSKQQSSKPKKSSGKAPYQSRKGKHQPAVPPVTSESRDSKDSNKGSSNSSSKEGTAAASNAPPGPSTPPVQGPRHPMDMSTYEHKMAWAQRQAALGYENPFAILGSPPTSPETPTVTAGRTASSSSTSSSSSNDPSSNTLTNNATTHPPLPSIRTTTPAGTTTNTTGSSPARGSAMTTTSSPGSGPSKGDSPPRLSTAAPTGVRRISPAVRSSSLKSWVSKDRAATPPGLADAPGVVDEDADLALTSQGLRLPSLQPPGQEPTSPPPPPRPVLVTSPLGGLLDSPRDLPSQDWTAGHPLSGRHTPYSPRSTPVSAEEGSSEASSDPSSPVISPSNLPSPTNNVAVSLVAPHVYLVDTIIGVEEDRVHEFKSIKGKPLRDLPGFIDDYAKKYINGFLNSMGGILYIGIEDDGLITGIVADKEARDKIRLRVDGTVAAFLPSVDPHLYRVIFVPVAGSVPDLFVLEIHVAQGRAPVYFTRRRDGQVYVRGEGSLQKLVPSAIAKRLEVGRKSAASLALSLATPGYSDLLPPDFVGRAEELDKIQAFVEDVRVKAGNSTTSAAVVALTGPPGAGKSAFARRLGYELASMYPDGVHRIEMSDRRGGYVTPLDAMRSLTSAVAPDSYNHRHGASEIDVRAKYNALFTDREVVIIVENVGTAEDVAEFVPSVSNGSHVLVLATSRRPLDAIFAGGGMAWLSLKMGPLAPQDAISLLQSEVPRLSHHDAAILVDAAGYMPLAVRMVASVAKNKTNISPTSLTAALSSDPGSTLHGLVGIFEAALNALPPKLRRDVLYPLCVFPGSFDTNAAAAVLDMHYDITSDALGRLLENSLLDFDVATGRYAQNDLLRSYVMTTVNAKALKTYKNRFVDYYKCLLVVNGNGASASSATPAAPKKKKLGGLFRRWVGKAACGSPMDDKDGPSSSDSYASVLSGREGSPNPVADGTDDGVPVDTEDVGMFLVDADNMYASMAYALAESRMADVTVFLDWAVKCRELLPHAMVGALDELRETHQRMEAKAGKRGGKGARSTSSERGLVAAELAIIEKMTRAKRTDDVLAFVGRSRSVSEAGEGEDDLATTPRGSRPLATVASTLEARRAASDRTPSPRNPSK